VDAQGKIGLIGASDLLRRSNERSRCPVEALAERVAPNEVFLAVDHAFVSVGASLWGTAARCQQGIRGLLCAIRGGEMG
jgi:hypothetical protein